ncbi:hypothetical protein T8S45_05665 [Blastomonas marina]|nr:hypothetical protein [Blastomonas marina]WPZ05024.1 hypothetical protein T8S45_05665 [Blastomonas marina]
MSVLLSSLPTAAFAALILKADRVLSQPFCDAFAELAMCQERTDR